MLVFHRSGTQVTCPMCSTVRRTAQVLSKENGVLSCVCGGLAFVSPDGTAVVRVTRVIKFADKRKQVKVWDMTFDGPVTDVAPLLHPLADEDVAIPEGMLACGDAAMIFTDDGQTRDAPHASLWLSKTVA